MAEASDFFPIADDLSIDTSTSFWLDMYACNQDDNTSSSSRRDLEWGWVFDKPTGQTKKKKKRNDVGSSSAVNSASDLSEALSAISAQLSLSLSSSSSSSQSSHTSGEDPVGILPESDRDDLLSLYSNEDGTQAQWTLDGSKEIQKDNVQVPELGMTFCSEEEVYKLYKNYAKETGFRARKGKVQRLSNGGIRRRYFFCSKQGFRSKKQFNKITKYKRKETRTGCNAKIQCTVENGKWVISKFLQEHNHELEDQRHMIGQSTKTSDAHLMIHTDDEVAMPRDARTAKRFKFCNTKSKRKINSLQPADAQSLLNSLRYMQDDDPLFFYAVQLDANGQAVNFFCRDGRSKIDYGNFGDVLILDTTFKMENFEMTCALFLGLDHHQQHVLYGCAFLFDESTDSFVWLFEAFMKAMGRHRPRTIITDESHAVSDAINKVLPEAKHQISLWYICHNASKNLSTYYAQPGFEDLFNECISANQTEEEFESKWYFLLLRFNLRENPWLNALYMSKERWAPVFNKTTFCAGIQLNAIIESIFQHLKSKPMSLSMFFKQYLQAAGRLRGEELYEDFHCDEIVPVINGGAMEPLMHKTLNLINKSAAIEKNQKMAEIYKNIALKWVEDVLKSESTVLKLISSNGLERGLDKNPANSEGHHEEHSLDKQAVKAMAETANDGTPGTGNSSSNLVTSDMDKHTKRGLKPVE